MHAALQVIPKVLKALVWLQSNHSFDSILVRPALKGTSLVLLVFVGLQHLLFAAARSGFVLPLEDSILDCFFSLLG